MSFHVSDAERLAALHTAARFGRRKRRDWFSLRRGRRVNAWDRRSSNTSDDSNLSNLGSMVSEKTPAFCHSLVLGIVQEEDAKSHPFW